MYWVDIPYLDASGKVCTQSAGMILPHEWFGGMLSSNADIFLKLLGGGPSLTQQWWDLAEEGQPEWWSSHPLRRQILSSPTRYIPIRLWGDDAPIGKRSRRSVSAVTWTGCVASGQTADLRHFLIYAAEEKK